MYKEGGIGGEKGRDLAGEITEVGDSPNIFQGIEIAKELWQFPSCLPAYRWKSNAILWLNLWLARSFLLGVRLRLRCCFSLLSLSPKEYGGGERRGRGELSQDEKERRGMKKWGREKHCHMTTPDINYTF